MKENIIFVKDPYIDNSSIDNIVKQIDTFHRFIIINSQTVVGNEMRTFNRRASKVIDGGNTDRLILNISMQKKISENLEISYILKSSNGIIIVNSVQKYTSLEEISKDMVAIIDHLKYLYSDEYVEEPKKNENDSIEENIDDSEK